jgi:heme exporter protein B
MMNSLSLIWTLFAKDIRIEWRERETVASVSVFGLLVVLIFDFGFQPAGEESLRLVPGLLWIAFAFSGILSFNRSFEAERENACLEGLYVSPADPGLIYLAKLLANMLFLGIAEVVIVLVTAVWYNFSFLPSFKWFALIVFLGTLGYAAVGATFAAVAANARMREVLLPVLQFPVVFPLFVASVEATTSALRGSYSAEMVSWIKLLAGFAVIFTVLSYLLFEYVMGE